MCPEVLVYLSLSWRASRISQCGALGFARGRGFVLSPVTPSQDAALGRSSFPVPAAAGQTSLPRATPVLGITLCDPAWGPAACVCLQSAEIRTARESRSTQAVFVPPVHRRNCNVGLPIPTQTCWPRGADSPAQLCWQPGALC